MFILQLDFVLINTGTIQIDIHTTDACHTFGNIASLDEQQKTGVNILKFSLKTFSQLIEEI